MCNHIYPYTVTELCESLSHVWLFCNSMDHNLPGSSVHEILQAWILEWVAISFSMRKAQGNLTQRRRGEDPAVIKAETEVMHWWKAGMKKPKNGSSHQELQEAWNRLWRALGGTQPCRHPDFSNKCCWFWISGFKDCKWGLGSITMYKASGGDGIPAKLFQILKGYAVKVLHSICQQIWNSQQW